MLQIEKFKEAFKQLNVNRNKNFSYGIAPHKPCFLLAVIDLIETGHFRQNEIRYEPRLLEKFDRYFEIIYPEQRPNRSYYPFVFLASEGFWNLHGQDRSKLEISSNERYKLGVSGHTKVSKTVKFVSLSDELYRCLQESNTRNQLREVIVDKWFPDHRHQIRAEFNKLQQEIELGVDELEDKLAIDTNSDVIEKWRKVNQQRDRKFRIAVLRAYGYQCAATGWKLKATEDTTLLEAAHIIPLAEKPDNRPQNGMALTPTVHRAMDNHLISPGPDYNWHVSEFLRTEAKADNGANWLSELDGSRVILPKDKSLRPSSNVLEWRYERFAKESHSR